MKIICVDGKPLQENITGIGHYLLNLLKLIDDKYPDSEFIIFTNRPIRINLNLKNYRIVIDHSVFAKFKPMIWYKFFAHRLINKYKPDFFLAGATFIPVFLKNCKIISIVHDINQKLAPETMPKLHSLTYRFFFKTDVKRANYLISNSLGTADKLLKYYKIKSDFILYPPINSAYRVIESEAVLNKLKTLNFQDPYILTVATHEPRKKLKNTVNAFLYLKSLGEIPAHKLLLVGGKGWKDEGLQQLIKSDENIIQTGYIADEDMPYLFNGADAFVLPSKYEGFGMPAREAVLCGKKPVISDIAELHEATQNYGYFIDPENIVLFAEAILRSIEDNNSESDRNKELDMAIKKIQTTFYKQESLFLEILKNHF